MPDDFERLKIEEEAAAADGTDDDKKRQKRGGKGLLRVKKKEDVPKRICVSRAARGKKKSVTVVTGLSTFGGSNISVHTFYSSVQELQGDGTSPLRFYFYKSYIFMTWLPIDCTGSLSFPQNLCKSENNNTFPLRYTT